MRASKTIKKSDSNWRSKPVGSGSLGLHLLVLGLPISWFCIFCAGVAGFLGLLDGWVVVGWVAGWLGD